MKNTIATPRPFKGFIRKYSDFGKRGRIINSSNDTTIKIVLSPINHMKNSALLLSPPLNCLTKFDIPDIKGSEDIKTKDKAARTAKIQKMSLHFNIFV